MNVKVENRTPKYGRNSQAGIARIRRTARKQVALDMQPSDLTLVSAFSLRSSSYNTFPCTGANPGFMLTEALVYIGVLFLLLGIGYSAMYRSIDNSVALRRNADDIMSALHAGERWRADVRLASQSARWDNSNEPVFRLEGLTNQIDYRFAGGVVYRRTDTGPWLPVLEHVQTSSMEREVRPTVALWRWELDLQTKARGSFRPGRVRPLFTFLAVSPATNSP